MAEWKEIIHNIKRVCEYNNGECSTCRFGTEACPNNSRFDIRDEECFDEFAEKVMVWTKEHPEPFYPTWGEWLQDLGLIEKRRGNFTNYGPGQIYTETRDVDILTYKGYQPIPADFAKKLEIKPKENS